MKRILLLSTIVLLLLIVGIAVVQAQVNDFPTTITMVAYIRSGPGPEFPSYGLLRPPALFRVDGRNTNGNWVRGITERGTVGWVDSGAIDITYGELTSLVIVSNADPFVLSPPTGTERPAVQEPAPAAADEAEAVEGEMAEDAAVGDTVAPVATGLLENLPEGYEGGYPAGPKINGGQGDHAAHIYPVWSGEGVRFLHVYRIVGSEGVLIMAITPEDVAPYADNPPAEPVLLKYEDGPGRFGPAALYILPDGTLQFNIGPDDENRIQALIFEGPEAGNLLDYDVFVPPSS